MIDIERGAALAGYIHAFETNAARVADKETGLGHAIELSAALMLILSHVEPTKEIIEIFQRQKLGLSRIACPPTPAGSSSKPLRTSTKITPTLSHAGKLRKP
jgi:hypothetical protein